ncbi:MAG: hypothetical protein V3R99_05715 [Thermoguttaceae bacterium]
MRLTMVGRFSVAAVAALLLTATVGAQEAEVPPQDEPSTSTATLKADTQQPVTRIGISTGDQSTADPQPSAADPKTVDLKMGDSTAAESETAKPLTVQKPSSGLTASGVDEEPLIPIPDGLESGPIGIQAASFAEVTPGLTTMEEVEEAWGVPKEIRKQDGVLTQLYTVEPFKRVEVSYFDDKVVSIVIRFDHSFAVDTLQEQLELADVRPVLVSDELGRILGQVYPERGVLFAFAPLEPVAEQPADPPVVAPRQVVQIILEPITAEPFALRAETYIDSDLDLSKLDIQQALRLQPDNARAHWLHSRILVGSGMFDEAVAAGGRAIALEPENPRYRVTQAQILGQMGQLDEAVREAEKAVETSQRRRHVRARALCLLGDLTASGKRPNFSLAIDYHMRAIKEADPLVVDPHPAVRLAAKEVLVDAHLGAAHDIAWGNWNEKEKAVPRWLDRADAFINDLIENEGGDQEYRFRASTRALAACVGVRGTLDPAKWADEAVRVGETLIEESQDSRRKAQYQWDLGMALYDALQIYQMGSDHTTALKYGERAIEYLEQGHRQKDTATTAYLLGRLYFRLGAIHAIRDENHKAAITWFDKAAPLLQRPIPADIYADVGRNGETFVSMGVSYWESGQRDKAVSLTEHGITLMEKAVGAGTLDASALAIPYGNLASMHRQLGNADAADRFESLAAKNGQTTLQ